MSLSSKLFRTIFATIVACVPFVASAQLGSVESVQKDVNSVVVKTSSGSLEITAFGDSIISVLPKYERNDVKPKKSASVILEPSGRLSVNEKSALCVTVSTSAITVSINRSNSLVTFINRRTGTRLLAEAAPMVTAQNGKTVYSFEKGVKEAYYGAGERGVSVDLNGEKLVCFNKQNYGYGKGDRTSQMNITMPYLLSNRGYGIFFDDYSASELSLERVLKYTTEIKNPVRYFFMLGDEKSLGATVKQFTALVGRQDLPPFWSLGYITSKYGYKTQQETENVVDSLKTMGYPLDGVVLDLYWYGKESDMGRWEWMKSQWPNHREMLRKFKNKGVKLVCITQPYLNKIGAIDNYNMASKAGMLALDSVGGVHDVHTWVGDAGMLDITVDKTCQWMWSRYKALTDEGVTGWWGDLGEPEVHPLSIIHHNGETAAEYHNRYGNDWSAIIYNGFKKDYPQTRLMSLMRGGTAGLQRYSVFPWSTDVGRSWAGLQAQIPIMINSSLSGLGYMSNDVGGFAVDPANPIDEELYARWLELGLFIPVLRTHSTVWAEPYHYTSYGYQDAFRKLIRSRYAWLPYNYTLAYQNTTTGAPFVRPMNYYDAQNVALSNIQDQYFWGRDLIIAPIIEKGETSRKVVLPEGKWYDYNCPTKVYNGGGSIKAEASVLKIPVFVRGGAIIPQATCKMESTDDYDASALKVTYYPVVGKSAYDMYEDDRTSATSLADKAYNILHFNAETKSNGKSVIKMEVSGNGYYGAPAVRNVKFVIAGVKRFKKITVNGNEIKNYEYDEVNETIAVTVGVTKKVTVKLVK